MGDYVDFKAVKAAASVGTVAARYGVDLRRVNASHERGKCPLPSHPAGDEKESFSVNAEKRVWICHSTICAKGRKGRKGGDVIELVAAMEQCSLREAGLKLAEWFLSSGQPAGKTVGALPVEPAPVAVNGLRRSDYEIYYQPLVEWIEGRMSMSCVTAFEKTAYISVLGRIEELANAEKV